MEVFLDYSIYRGFLDHDFCDKVANTYKEHSVYAPRGDWNAYNVNKGSLYTEILEIFSPVVPYKFTEKWINITEYNKGDRLRDHRDNESSLTIVSEIREADIGGRFIINKDTYIELNKGDVITFNGSHVMHGVEMVERGSRLSLNMWTYPNVTKDLL